MRRIEIAALASSTIAFVGCVQLFDIHERDYTIGNDAAADTGDETETSGLDPSACADGPVFATCGTISVDLCTDEANCGACGVACKDAFGIRQCTRGVCYDHDEPHWAPVQNPTCDAVAPDPVLLDANTGLMWAIDPLGPEPTMEQAEGDCEALALDGFTDWKLPTMIELASLADYLYADAVRGSNCSPKGAPLGRVCTRSQELIGGTSQIYMLLSDGQMMATDPALHPCDARCVRATKLSAPSPRFVHVTDGIYDQATNLTWTPLTPQSADAGPDPYAMSKFEAESHCNDQPTSGVFKWRVPNVKELQTLIDVRHFGPTFDDTVFGDFVDALQAPYWAFDSVAASSTRAWFVSFDEGTTQWGDASAMAHVRCVHDGRLP